MRFVQLAAVFVATLCAAPIQAASASGDDAVRRTTEALQALRKGGFVVVVTHGAAAAYEADTNVQRLDDCAGQQSLSDTGRLMASGIGKLLASEHVPVGSVLASRYCRTVETAERIAENTRTRKILKVDDLNNGAAAIGTVEKDRRAAALRQLAGKAPTARTNTIIVTHKPNVADAFGPDFASVSDAEIVIFKPTAGGVDKQYELAYRLKIEDVSAYNRSRTSASQPRG